MVARSTRLVIAGIEIEVVYKQIKNLNITVYAPRGQVRISAPKYVRKKDIIHAVESRLSWIKKQQTRIAQNPPPEIPKLVNGELHYLWGQPYRLEVVERAGRPRIEKLDSSLRIYVPPQKNRASRQQILDRWYREQLKSAVPVLLEKWEPQVNRQVSGWTLRRMKTRWGSCNTQTAKINLNTELVKQSPQCLEYVVVHELAHLRERHHNAEFKALLDTLLPRWRTIRDELNRGR